MCRIDKHRHTHAHIHTADIHFSINDFSVDNVWLDCLVKFGLARWILNLVEKSLMPGDHHKLCTYYSVDINALVRDLLRINELC